MLLNISQKNICRNNWTSGKHWYLYVHHKIAYYLSLKKMQVLRSFPTSARETCIVEAGLRSALQYWEARNFKRRDWKVQITSFQYFLKCLYLIFTFYLYTLHFSMIVYYLTKAFLSTCKTTFFHMKKLARILMYRPWIDRPYFKARIRAVKMIMQLM